MRIGSLFSGYGGLDLAVERYFGGTTAWFVEFDKHPSAILAHHWPDIPNYGDITAVDWDAVEPVDILCGGFPCQDVSHAGLRRGVRPGTRSGLWEHFAYAINALRPGLVVIENVYGLLSADAAGDVAPCPWCVGDEPDGHMRALGAVLSDLAEIGFDAERCSVRASDAGAPHRRERVFIVAAADAGSETVGLGTGLRTGEPGGIGRGRSDDDDPQASDLTLLPTPAVNDMGRGKTPQDWDDWTQAMRDKHGNGNGHGKSLEIEAQRLLPTPKASDGPNGGPGMRNGRGVADALPGVVGQLLTTPTAALDAGGGQRSHRWSEGSRRTHNPVELARDITDGKMSDFGPYTAAIARWEQVLGRPAPSPTEPGKDGRPRLSPRFVEWMMGLPDGWVCDTGIPRNAQLKALGNGVVPAQAALALSLLLPRLAEDIA